MTCYDCIHWEACRNILEKLNPEYIGKNIIIKSICNKFQNKTTFIDIIKCKDCKNCVVFTDSYNTNYYFCNNTVNTAEVKPNDFCSYAIRKEKKKNDK